MKKIITLLMFSALLATSAIAQRGLRFGVTYNPSAVFIVKQNNYETLDGCAVISRSELDYKMKWGYTAGGIVGFNFNKRIGLYTGLRYVRTGQNYEDTFNPGTQFCPSPYHVVREVDLRYLRVPLMFQYTFSFKNPKFKMYTEIGPYIGWLRSANESVIINDLERTDLTPTMDKFNKMDVGASFGVGGEYFITRSFYLSLGLATDFGITDMNGAAVKDLEWFSKNDVGYLRSHNFNAGLSIGLHYIINPGASNPFKKRSGDDPAPPDVTR